MPTERIEEIISKIKVGISFSELQKEYPITRKLYEKLGGPKPVEKVAINSLNLESLFGVEKKKVSNIDEEIALGGLLGDSNIYKSHNSDITYTYSFGHCWEQISYVKMKTELLGAKLSRVRLEKPKDIPGINSKKDYSIHAYFSSDPRFNTLYEMFYNHTTDKVNPAKNVLQKDIAERITPKVLAIWLMDDGKKYGTGKYSFSITIGKQPHYTYELFSNFVGIINEILGISLNPREEKLSYELTAKSDVGEEIFFKIASYVHPHFSYKFGVTEDECGDDFKGSLWYKKWSVEKKKLVHPFLEEHTLPEYRSSEDDAFKDRFFRSLYTQCIVRGFPYYSLDDSDKKKYWKELKRSKIKDTDKILKASPRTNIFPNSFMNHRYKVGVSGKQSPYSVYKNRNVLKKILLRQLTSGDAISDSNIRNAVSFYGSQVAGQFSPSVAKYIIDRYCIVGGTVLDPCSGWGGRLSGCICANRNYYGIEPNTETYNRLLEMKDWILSIEKENSITLINGVAEDISSYSGLFDFAITSPPYFDHERYSLEPTQSYLKFPEYGSWKTGFLRPLLENVFFSLKEGSCLALVVADVSKHGLVLDSILMSKEIGYDLEDVYKMSGYRVSKEFGDLSETILILRRKHGKN